MTARSPAKTGRSRASVSRPSSHSGDIGSPTNVVGRADMLLAGVLTKALVVACCPRCVDPLRMGGTYLRRALTAGACPVDPAVLSPGLSSAPGVDGGADRS